MSLLTSNQHMGFLLLCYGTGRISDILCFGCGLSSEAFLLLVQIRIIVLGMSARETITSSWRHKFLRLQKRSLELIFQWFVLELFDKEQKKKSRTCLLRFSATSNKWVDVKILSAGRVSLRELSCWERPFLHQALAQWRNGWRHLWN